jgi:hypothetical protein
MRRNAADLDFALFPEATGDWQLKSNRIELRQILQNIKSLLQSSTIFRSHLPNLHCVDVTKYSIVVNAFVLKIFVDFPQF